MARTEPMDHESADRISAAADRDQRFRRAGTTDPQTPQTQMNRMHRPTTAKFCIPRRSAVSTTAARRSS